jgi:hypothetical protein
VAGGEVAVGLFASDVRDVTAERGEEGVVLMGEMVSECEGDGLGQCEGGDLGEHGTGVALGLDKQSVGV